MKISQKSSLITLGTDSYEKIGNIVMCLHYISRESRKEKLHNSTKIINNAICSIAEESAIHYQESVQTHLNNNICSRLEFVELFCPIKDFAVKNDLIEILQSKL